MFCVDSYPLRILRFLCIFWYQSLLWLLPSPSSSSPEISEKPSLFGSDDDVTTLVETVLLNVLSPVERQSRSPNKKQDPQPKNPRSHFGDLLIKISKYQPLIMTTMTVSVPSLMKYTKIVKLGR